MQNLLLSSQKAPLSGAQGNSLFPWQTVIAATYLGGWILSEFTQIRNCLCRFPKLTDTTFEHKLSEDTEIKLTDGKSELYTLCPQFVRAASNPGSYVGCHRSWVLAGPQGSGISQEAQHTKMPSKSSTWITCPCNWMLWSSLLVKCFWAFRPFFKYKSTEYRFPVGEDGAVLVSLKVEQKSPVWADVWRSGNIHKVHLHAGWNTVTCRSPGGARSEGAASPGAAAVQPAAEAPCPAKGGGDVRRTRGGSRRGLLAVSMLFLPDERVKCFIPETVFFHFITWTSDWDIEPELGLSSGWLALPSALMISSYPLWKMHLGDQIFC